MTDRPGKPSDDEREVAETVLAYLHSHPQAADTLDGIVTWWLPRQRYMTARGRIEGVLGRMVAEGLLRRDELPDGSALYTLVRRSAPIRRH